jgi:hypothetical protein
MVKEYNTFAGRLNLRRPFLLIAKVGNTEGKKTKWEEIEVAIFVVEAEGGRNWAVGALRAGSEAKSQLFLFNELMGHLREMQFSDVKLLIYFIVSSVSLYKV